MKPTRLFLVFYLSYQAADIRAAIAQTCKQVISTSSENFRDESFPALARILDDKNNFLCNGAIIKPRQILTGKFQM